MLSLLLSTLSILLLFLVAESDGIGPSGFALAYLQKDLDESYDNDAKRSRVQQGTGLRRDDVLSDAKCIKRCNDDLNIEMDMVNAHMAFGSIDVPSVVSERDLWLFCEIDRRHSRCLDECGYSVQFNLREYVCRNRYQEMLTHLPCFAASAPQLTRTCRERCGEVTKLQHNVYGYAARCRQLLCDHTCAQLVIEDTCGRLTGRQANQFLLDFSRLQIEYWIRDFARKSGEELQRVYPMSCARLQCQNFQLQNCTKGFLQG